MTSRAERFASAAERLAGSKFVLHGRDPATGIDCVGVVLLALRAVGINLHIPPSYALRNIDIGRHLTVTEASALVEMSGTSCRGDMLLVTPGIAQQHLIVALGGTRFIHAHAGLRRIVVQHGFAHWPVLRHWRLSEI